MDDVESICNAYESGVGHRGRPTAAVNPYPVGSHEHKAYALGAAGKAVTPAEEKAAQWSVEDVIEKIVDYGHHRENEGGSYATFQKSEARRHKAEADDVLAEVRAMLIAAQVTPAEAKVADDVRLGNRLYVWDHENPEDGSWDNIEEYLHDTTPGVGDVVRLNLAMPLRDVEVEMLEVGRSGEPIRWQVRDVKTGAMLAAKAKGGGA